LFDNINRATCPLERKNGFWRKINGFWREKNEIWREFKIY
jgi:hypothetical protein